MMRSIFLVAALTFACAIPALGQSVCVAPAPPEPINGATATQEEVLAAVREAKAFIAQSDLYQTCLQQEMKEEKARAEADNKPFDDMRARLVLNMTDENQKLKEKVGAEANGAVDAYKRAHP